MDPTLGSYHGVLGSLVLGSLVLGSYHGVLGSLVLGSLVLWSLVLGILVLRAPRTKAPSHFPNPPVSLHTIQQYRPLATRWRHLLKRAVVKEEQLREIELEKNRIFIPLHNDTATIQWK